MERLSKMTSVCELPFSVKGSDSSKTAESGTPSMVARYMRVLTWGLMCAKTCVVQQCCLSGPLEAFKCSIMWVIPVFPVGFIVTFMITKSSHCLFFSAPD